MSRIKGTFVSVWAEGTVITPCELDPSNGELFPATADVGNDYEHLEREYFQTLDQEMNVCNTCHSFIMKVAMNPGIGHDLNEEQECSNPECDSHDPLSPLGHRFRSFR